MANLVAELGLPELMIPAILAEMQKQLDHCVVYEPETTVRGGVELPATGERPSARPPGRVG